MQEIKNKILDKINMEQEISPFLFIWENTELLEEKVKNLALEILEELNIPKTEIYTFKTEEKSIKIDEMKNFISKVFVKSPYKIQIFIINNFDSATLATSNSLLKILEEPWKQNLIFLTNKSESGILETILSRVQTIKLDLWNQKITNNFFYDLIDSYLKDNNLNLIKYFFTNKLEKQECIDFLNTLKKYFIDNFIYIDFLEELQDDIEKVSKNNVLGKYVVDKWILKIK